MRPILETANDEQEYVSPLLSHLHPVDVTAAHIEEAPHVFKNLNEDQSELIQRKLNT